MYNFLCTTNNMLQRIKKQKPIFIDELFGLPAGYDFDLNEPNDERVF